jgi:hypothetical protein
VFLLVLFELSTNLERVRRLSQKLTRGVRLLVIVFVSSARGIAINHWYHVKVELDPSIEKGTIIRHEPEEGFPNTPSGGRFDRAWGMGGWKLDPEHKSDPYAARKMPE